MKMTCNSRMQSLILVTALSIGLFFASPVAARLLLLDSSGKVLSELGTGEVLVSYISSPQAYGINDAGQVGGTFYAEDHSIASFITGPNGVGMTGLGHWVEGPLILTVSPLVLIVQGKWWDRPTRPQVMSTLSSPAPMA